MFEVSGAGGDEMWSSVSFGPHWSHQDRRSGRINGSSYFKMLLRTRFGLHSRTLNDAFDKRRGKKSKHQTEKRWAGNVTAKANTSNPDFCLLN